MEEFNSKNTIDEKKEFIKSCIKTQYVPYEVKADTAKAIINACYWRNVDGRKVFHVDSVARYMVTMMAIVELYTNIDQALMSYYGQDLTGMTFTVYTTIGLSKESIIEPDITQTPLSSYTNPIWCISPLKLVKLTKIKVLGKDSYIDFKFGPRSLPGKIWKYKWIEWNGYEKPVLGDKKEDKHYYQTKEQNRKYQSIELLAKNNKGKTIEILKDTQPYCVIKVGIDGSYKIMKRL